MSNRKVRTLLYAQEVDMGGMKVRQSLPAREVERIDPYLLLHHHKTVIKEGSDIRNAGVGPHPHRGFTPVTFIFRGGLHHRDSRGNSDIVEAGGIQWMDSGMGIIHSERPSAELAAKGGDFELIQIWLNLPKENKMDQPRYQAVKPNEVPLIENKATIYVYAGEFMGKKGPIEARLPVICARCDMKAEVEETFEVPENFNAFIYLVEGRIKVKDYGLVENLNLVYFENEGEEITVEASEDSKFLLLAGRPIDEPVTIYGPFVMNDHTEIMEAMRDYQMGKMGVLVEEFD